MRRTILIARMSHAMRSEAVNHPGLKHLRLQSDGMIDRHRRLLDPSCDTIGCGRCTGESEQRSATTGWS